MVESEEELKKKKNYVYLFILLPQGLSYSMRIFSYGMLALGCGMYDLVPWTEIELGPLNCKQGFFFFFSLAGILNWNLSWT